MENLTISGNTSTNTSNIEKPFFSSRRKADKRKESVLPTYKDYTLREFLNTKKDKAFNYKKIFGSLIAEGDLTIFFGKTGTGKSLLSYQLAEAIASGRNFFDMLEDNIVENYDNGEQKYYKLVNTTQAQKVLYVDFEMSGEQIVYRYSHKNENGITIYQHHENLKILKFDSRGFADKTLYVKSIEEYIIKSGIKIVFIDNMSNISMKGEDADFSTNVMNMLKDMQEKHGLTLTILAHTPKVDGLAIKTEDMLKGSSNFAIFADSIFCISETTKGNEIRYLKQFKKRFGDKDFGEEKVIEIEFKENDNGNKGFIFNGYFNENEEISENNKVKKEALKAEIIDMIQRNEDISTYAVAKRLYINFGNGRKWETYLQQCKRIVITINKEKNEIIIPESIPVSQNHVEIPDNLNHEAIPDNQNHVEKAGRTGIEMALNAENIEKNTLKTPEINTENVTPEVLQHFTQVQLDNFEDILPYNEKNRS